MATPSDIQTSLGGVDFPCSKAALLKHARDKNAPADVLAALNGLPDREFATATEVMEAMRG